MDKLSDCSQYCAIGKKKYCSKQNFVCLIMESIFSAQTSWSQKIHLEDSDQLFSTKAVWVESSPTMCKIAHLPAPLPKLNVRNI